VIVRALVPIVVRSTPNLREHWAVRGQTAKLHRRAAAYSLAAAGKPPRGNVTVTMTRRFHGQSRAFDCDNLAAGCKAARDGIADWLGRDDGDPSIMWHYAQERVQAKNHAGLLVIVESA